MMIDAGSLSRVKTASVASTPANSLNLDFGADMRFRISFDDERAAEYFNERYQHMVTVEDGVAFALDVARDRDGTHLFRVTRGATYAWRGGALTSGDVAFLADAVATTTAFTRLRDTITLHAATIRSGSGAFALVGDSGAGKTTTAVACALSGHEVYSDEFCIVSKGSVRPFPRCLSLRPGGIAVLRRLRVTPAALREDLHLREARGWSNVRFDRLFGRIPTDERAPLRAIFLLAGRAEHPSIEPLAPTAMLSAAARYAKSSSPAFERVAEVLQLLRSLACYRLVVGDPNETVAAIAQTVA
ncbi:MAG: hypothetical protein ACYDGM_03660 [Vulcanimicrobiaceae bacterium]